MRSGSRSFAKVSLLSAAVWLFACSSGESSGGKVATVGGSSGVGNAGNTAVAGGAGTPASAGATRATGAAG
jgi:hypothetical protein